jgi:signal transduction histidine kinase
VNASPSWKPARRAASEFLYVTAGAPLGFSWCLALAIALSVGVATSIVIVGIPLLALTLIVVHWGANTERERAAMVLGAPIARLPRPASGTSWLRRWRARLSDRATWKELGYMLLLGPVGIFAGGVVLALWAAALAALASPAVATAAPAGSWLAGLSSLALVGLALGGLVLAAISLVATRGLALACASLASGLLAPNERAVLAARVRALEETRAGVVESADAQLRRLERDLHDGAQHRLAYIAMELDRARARMHTDPEAANELLGRAHEESKKAMSELRDLVRGIHPSVLTDRGLDAAVSGLAERCPVPVDVSIRLAARPPTAVETAAYYVVAESLTNVAKHARAQSVAVEIRGDDSHVQIEVRDDGAGGAARVPGSGLEGLAQRVEALDGTVSITSPQGGPTTIRVELPCAS